LINIDLNTEVTGKLEWWHNPRYLFYGVTQWETTIDRLFMAMTILSHFSVLVYCVFS